MKKKFLILALGLVCTANYSQEKSKSVALMRNVQP